MLSLDNNFLQSLVESSPDIIIAVDREGTIIFYNDGARKNLHYSADEIVGQKITTIYPSLDEARRVMKAMRAAGEDVFSPQTLAFYCNVPADGKYRVSIVALAGPDQGLVELIDEEHPVGQAADLYAAQRHKSSVVPMGSLMLKQGLNPIFFRLPGKNPKSSGLGLDLVEIQLEK